MRTVARYIIESLVTTFAVCLVVLIFVMSSGLAFKVADLIARGVAFRPLAMMFVYALPAVLSIAIPFAILVSNLLVFGRLSADGEITAMRACGISIWQIMLRPLLISMLLSAICLHINDRMAPESHYLQKQSIIEMGRRSAIDLLEEGRFTPISDGLTIYVGKKNKSSVFGVRICDQREQGFTREIIAEYGTVGTAQDGSTMEMILHKVRIEPLSRDKNDTGYCETFTFKANNAVNRKSYKRGNKDMTLDELLGEYNSSDLQLGEACPESLIRKTGLAVEINKRLVLALSCMTFTLLGVPLGIKAHRRDSTSGTAISLGLVFAFYLFVITAESMVRYPAAHPELIVWIPIFAFSAFGLFLAGRSA